MPARPTVKLLATTLASFITLVFFLPADRSGCLFRTCLIDRPYSPSCDATEDRAEIINLVHFVSVLREPDADFTFEFNDYFPVYSAWHHWRPVKIFFHTNALKDTIARAQNGGKWNHLIFNMPSIVINQVTAPTYANNGVAIRNIEHKSDFIRVKAAHDLGGVYIDFDVYPLRDINALRECNFRVIAGRQVDVQVNSRAFMAARGSEMLRLWMRGMHGRYTGGGTTHSNEVLTRVGERVAEKKGRC